jgi:uncharacterized membrane protein
MEAQYYVQNGCRTNPERWRRVYGNATAGHLCTLRMIQRKQTLFLLLAAIGGGLTFLFPVETFTQGDRNFIFQTSGLYLADGTPVVDVGLKVPFHWLIGFLAAVFLAAIFFFKQRRRQLAIVRSANLLLIGATVFLFITSNSVRAWLEQGGRVGATYGASAVLPLAMIVFAFLAERGIRRDEKLVRSMDRLR